MLKSRLRRVEVDARCIDRKLRVLILAHGKPNLRARVVDVWIVQLVRLDLPEAFEHVGSQAGRNPGHAPTSSLATKKRIERGLGLQGSVLVLERVQLTARARHPGRIGGGYLNPLFEVLDHRVSLFV